MAESKILGIANMRANFALLDEGALQVRIGRKMVVAGGRILKAEAKAIAEAKGLRKSGALIKNIVIKREPQAPAGTVQYNLGVRHGPSLTKKQKTQFKLAVGQRNRIVKKYDDDPFYWRFPEFGTAHQAATPYLAPALENKASAAIDAMGAALDVELKKASTA